MDIEQTEREAMCKIRIFKDLVKMGYKQAHTVFLDLTELSLLKFIAKHGKYQSFALDSINDRRYKHSKRRKKNERPKNLKKAKTKRPSSYGSA